MKKQIIANILSNYAGRVVSLLIGFFLVPFLISKLGKELFGLILLFESLMLIVEAVSTSTRMALSRFVTVSVAQENWEEFKAYLSTGRSLFWVISAFVFLVGITISPLVPFIFRVPAAEQNNCRILFLLMTSAFAITIPNIVYWSGLYARQRFDLINLASSMGIITRGLLIFLIFSFFSGETVSIVTYGWVYLAITWLQNFIIFVLFRRMFPKIRIPIFGHWDTQKIRSVLSFSFYSLTGHLSQMFHYNIINFVVNRLWGPAYNALYGIGTKFPSILEGLTAHPTWTLMPTFTDLAARNENQKLKKLLFSYTKALTILVAPTCLVLIAFSYALIQLWVGDDFSESANLMVIGHLAQLFYLPILATHNLPTVYGKMRLPALLNIVMAVSSVISGLYFAKVLNMGLAGIALGINAVAVIYSFVFMVPYCLNMAKLPAGEYMRVTFFRPLVCAVLSFGGGLGLIYFIEKGFSISILAIGIMAVCAAMYAFATYYKVLDPTERGYVLETWQNIRRRLYSS